jgi:hypothetical protein
MGSHIIFWGPFGVIEGIVRKICTFDIWNIKKNKFKESYCIVNFFGGFFFFFAFIFYLQM